jgi:ribose transport system substrate-binding protein
MRNTLIALAVSACVAGCSARSNPYSPPVITRPVVGVSVHTFADPFFKEVADTLSNQFAQQDFEAVVLNCDLDPVQQHRQIKELIARKVSALVVFPCDPRAVGPVLQEANQAGIPVFTANARCTADGVQVTSHVALDDASGGRQAAQALIGALGADGGKVAVIDLGLSEQCQLRVQAFKEALAVHNGKGRGGSQVTLVAAVPGGGARDQGYRAATQLLQAYPDLAGIFAVDDASALGARSALELAGKSGQVKVVGYGGRPEGLKAVKEGRLYADVWEPSEVFSQELLSVVLLFDAKVKPTPEMRVAPRVMLKADVMKPRGLW